MLIVGVGNPDRSDDAAGLLVARRLQEMGIAAQEFTGDPLELIEAWTGSPEVILIDTVVSGAAAGTITVWDAAKTPLPPEQFCCSTHAFGIAEAVEIARVLDRLPARLVIYGIEGVKFDLSGSLSTEVAGAVERLAGEIAGSHVSPLPLVAAQ